jgi:hypothetical protein
MWGRGATHILNLVDGKVGVGGDASLLRLDINNDQEGVWCVALQQLVDLEVGGAELGARVVPAY